MNTIGTEAPPARPTVLIVEDDRDVQESYEAFFLQEEVRLLQAYDLVHARELFHAHADEIDAVVMDFNLIGEDTQELTREIRKAAGDALPIIGCSSSRSIRTRQQEFGCSSICEKSEVPGRLESLLDIH